jgi:hypothetical protein
VPDGRGAEGFGKGAREKVVSRQDVYVGPQVVLIALAAPGVGQRRHERKGVLAEGHRLVSRLVEGSGLTQAQHVLTQGQHVLAQGEYLGSQALARLGTRPFRRCSAPVWQRSLALEPPRRGAPSSTGGGRRVLR